MGFRLLAVIIPIALSARAQDVPRAAQVLDPPAAEDPARTPDTVVSRSEQFRVTGEDGLIRGTVAMLAEQAKDELLRLTEEKDAWNIPVAIRLHGRPGDPLPARSVAMRLFVIEGVMRLQIDIHLSRGIDRDGLQRAVTAALLYERALRHDPGDVPLLVPPWLADGLCEATAWRLNQSDRRLYEALFKRGSVFRLDDLFGMDEAEFESMDGATRAAFRVSSGALVMALLEQPQGRKGFRDFLNEAAAHQGEMPVLLRRHFPGLNLSENSLAKWWKLQLAVMGGLNPLTDILTILQTETQLAEVLHLHIRRPEGIFIRRPLDAWPQLAALAEPERQAGVRPAQDELVRLSYRCFPSYRPLLAEYQIILQSIAKNQTNGMAERLTSLEETRSIMTARATRARDYLDWFEITRARETSGAFDDYQLLKERLQANPHRRKDPLSAYLDRMERIFHRESGRPAWQSPADGAWSAAPW